MNNKLEQLLTDSSFVLWLRDECSAEEKKRWDRWLREDPEHQMTVREAKEIVIAVDSEYSIHDPNEKLDRVIDQYESQEKQKR